MLPETVRHIHKRGGTILGTSRGPQNEEVMAKFLIEKKIDILFTIGGDGTLRGSRKLIIFHRADATEINSIYRCNENLRGTGACKRQNLRDWNSEDHRQ
jgi:6-phosphofructokinase